MKKLTKMLLAIGMVTAYQGIYAQVYSSCGQWASFSDNGFTVYNNIWGSGAGTQCLWANAYNDWGVSADHPNTGGVKSYPNVSEEMSMNVNQMGTVVSSFDVSVPSAGSYAAAYDIWYDNYAYEIMLWMNWRGNVNPISYNWDAGGNPVPVVTNVTIGGHTWNVFEGTNGSNEVFSFVRTSQAYSGTVDIKAISTWLMTNGWFGNANMHKLEFGFEITSSAGGLDFTCNDYSLTYSTGGGECTPTAITPYVQVNGGTWQQTSVANVSSGNTVKFGPQPTQGGSWSWSGPNGFSATTREVTLSNIQTGQEGSYVATYTNTSGCQSSHTFSVTVSGGSGGEGCSGVPVWSATTVYQDAGTEVQYNGSLYRNRWYSYNQNPEQNSGPWEVWELLGTCSEMLIASTSGNAPAGRIDVHVYPNPSSVDEGITIRLGEVTGSTRIRITDLSGRLVKELVATEQPVVHVPLVRPGLYVMQVISKDIRITRKVKVLGSGF